MKRIVFALCAMLLLLCILVACDAETPVSITKSEIVKGELVITYSDGTSENLGKVVGRDGMDGEEGLQGPQGEKAEIENLEELDFYLQPDGTYGVSAGNSIYLETIVIPETYKGKLVTMILPYAFENSKSTLKKVVIPETVVEICEGAFKGCAILEVVDFTSTLAGLKKIGDEAFKGCYEIKNISIPARVESIGESAFENCRMLETVVFERNSNLKKIGSYAFASCDKLKSIVIPVGVTGTSYGTFSYCSNLSIIYYGGDSDQWASFLKIGFSDISKIDVYCFSSVRPNVTGGKYWHYAQNIPTSW